MPASPAPPPSSRPFSEHAKPGSALAGCFIPVIMGTVVAAILAWAAYSFFKQNAEIATFTENAPLVIEPSRLSAPERTALLARIETFADGPAGTLRLTAPDLNELIAGTPKLAALAPMCRVEAVTPEGIRATISFPMRRLGGGQRFLNGTLVAVPRVAQDQFFLEATALSAPDADIPDGFVQGYRQNRYLDNLFLRPFEKDEGIAAVLASIREARLEDGVVVLERSTAAASSHP